VGRSAQSAAAFPPPQNGARKPPIEVPVQDIEHYVIIKEDRAQDDPGRPLYISPYEKLELFWPLNLCRNGVEIIDSPGLNDDAERQGITVGYLPTVDAVLLVIACDFPVSDSERSAIDTIQQFGHEDIFFVCNRINMLPPEEHGRVRQRCLTILSPLTKRGSERIFFINARGALDGRLAHNPEQVNESNLPAVERALEVFLTTERGRIKIARPANELKVPIREARRAIPQRAALLKESLAVIQTRYDQAQGPLRQLEHERQIIVNKLEVINRDTIDRLTEAARRFYESLADKAPGWVNGYQIQNPITIGKIFSRAAQERVAKEVTDFLLGQMKSAFRTWQDGPLQQIFDGYQTRVVVEVGNHAEQFAQRLAETRGRLLADPLVPVTDAAIQREKISATERILAAAGGFLIDPAAAAMGLAFGYKEMLKNIIPQMAILLGVVLLVGWNPLLLLASTLSGAFVRTVIKAKGMNDEIKEAVGKQYVEKLRTERDSLARKMAGEIANKLAENQVALDGALALEIQNLRDQVESILREKQSGQAETDRAIRALEGTEREAEAIEQAVDDLIAQLAMS
jgi:hypothetical protein